MPGNLLNVPLLYVNDPHFDDAPQSVAIDNFLLAWLEMSNRYAVLSV